jgi:glycosyltransferase involved in cell wall biosynthesis
VNEDVAYVRRLEQRLVDAGVADDVRWLPNISKGEKQAFLRGLSFLCTPSRYNEAFGLYVLEAWASGVPVVLPARGAAPELMQVHGGGMIYDELVDGLRQALTALPELWEKAQRARSTVQERFTSDAMAAQFLKVLPECGDSSPLS